jgi:hypothetical protein
MDIAGIVFSCFHSVLKETVPTSTVPNTKIKIYSLNSAIQKLYATLPTCAMRELQAISMDRPIETSFTPISPNTRSSFLISQLKVT